MSRFLIVISFLICSISLHAQNVYEQVSLYLNSKDGVYHPGDTVKVTAVKISEGEESVQMTLMRSDNVQSETLITLFAGENLILTEVVSDPISVRLRVSPVADPETSTGIGYVVSPEMFRPGFTIPEDLRSFWDQKLDELRSLPQVVKIFPAEGVAVDDGGKFVCYKVEINMPNGFPCRGYVAYPKDAKPGSLPIYLYVHWAGVKGLGNRASANFAINTAREGYLCLDINAHGFKDDQPQAYYDELNEGVLKDYYSREFTGLSDYYFHNMYLRDIRAIDYAVTLPVWDGKRILVHGESQGGGQALSLAGIDSRITHCVAILPALTDMGAVLDGRKCGWPAESNAVYASQSHLGQRVMSYHDGAVLISLFKGKLYMEVGNIDDICDPAAVCAGYNNANIVESKEIHYYPWRPHSYKNMEERYREHWNQNVFIYREAFFKAYLINE